MNVVTEIRSLEKAVTHVPRLLALRQRLTFQQGRLLKYDKILDGWNDGVTTPEEQGLLNGVIEASGINSETSPRRKIGKLNAYFDNTNDVLSAKKKAHVWVGNMQGLLSLFPIATLPFREGISNIVEQTVHTSNSLDIATTLVLGGLSVLGVVAGWAEGQKNRQEGRIYGAQQKVLKAEVQLIKKDIKVNESNPFQIAEGKREQFVAYEESRLRNAARVLNNRGRVAPDTQPMQHTGDTMPSRAPRRKVV